MEELLLKRAKEPLHPRVSGILAFLDIVRETPCRPHISIKSGQR